MKLFSHSLALVAMIATLQPAPILAAVSYDGDCPNVANDDPDQCCGERADACNRIANLGGSASVGKGSCNGERACDQAGQTGSAVIGTNSCTGTLVCTSAGHNGNIVIGDNSCSSYASCFLIANTGTSDADLITIGDNSCRGEHCCRCLTTGDRIPNNSCNVVGADGCCSGDGSGGTRNGDIIAALMAEASTTTTAVVEATTTTTTTTTSNSGGGGDPHITTWQKEHYEYHGQCDLVMLKDPNFANGLGIAIHIRTKVVRHWSYIKTVTIKIGNDILEIEGSADAKDAEAHYWINFEYQGDLDTIGGLFPVTQKLPSICKRSYTIDLSPKYPGQSITVQLYKEFVRVKFSAKEDAFGNTVGLLGDFKTGKTLARDGSTVINDFTELGDEWQVLPSDGNLFHEVSPPQFPELCIKPEDPRGDRKRRLAESNVTAEQAEAACASLKDPLSIKDCVYDILATQDLDMVGAF